MTINLTKEDFIKLMDSIESFSRGTEELDKALGSCEFDDWFYSIRDTLIDFLNSIFYSEKTLEDIYFMSDIEYYIYDLDFGKNWKSGMVTINKEDFPIRNAGELWDFLTMIN